MFFANKSLQRAFLKGAILMTDWKQVENPKLLLFVHSHPVLINSCRCSILANVSVAACLSSLSSSAAFKRQLEAVLPLWFSCPPGSEKKNNHKNPVDLVQLRLVMKNNFVVAFRFTHRVRVIERKRLICGSHPGRCSAIKWNVSLLSVCLSPVWHHRLRLLRELDWTEPAGRPEVPADARGGPTRGPRPLLHGGQCALHPCGRGRSAGEGQAVPHHISGHR